MRTPEKERLIKHLLDQPKPKNLQDWAWQAIAASFPANDELAVTWGGVLQYIGWLENLPTTK
jgi:hypothetical protein